MKTYRSKDGVICDGDKVLDTWDADKLARANHLMYAERLVAAFDGKNFTVDKNNKIIRTKTFQAWHYPSADQP